MFIKRLFIVESDQAPLLTHFVFLRVILYYTWYYDDSFNEKDKQI